VEKRGRRGAGLNEIGFLFRKKEEKRGVTPCLYIYNVLF